MLWTTDPHTHMCFVNIPWQIYIISGASQWCSDRVELRALCKPLEFFNLVKPYFYGPLFVIVMLEQVWPHKF